VKIQRIDHVGVIVRDLAAAKAFFIDFGLEVLGEGELADTWIDRVVGLDGVKVAFVMLRTPDGQANIELITYYAPTDDRAIQQPAANTLGVRHIAFVVDDIEAVVGRLKQNGAETFGEIQQFEDSWKLCYVRGPEGMIIEPAEQIN
jgi:catechol 2,3-dioxygenase-like lactoylglutathione lyase family enzyme